MSLTSTAKRAASPGRAVRYYKGTHRGNEIPGLLWLLVLLFLVTWVRTGARPDANQMVTWSVLAVGIVALGAVAPAEVIAFLAVLLVAAVLNIAGPITGVLQNLEARVASLTGV